MLVSSDQTGENALLTPFPKSSTEDRRDLLSHHGIAVASSVYKLYCSILNYHLGRWSEDNGKIVDCINRDIL